MLANHYRNRFPVNESKRAREPLHLVHSDLCGKMNKNSLSAAEYFLTFIDDKSRYVWMYILFKLPMESKPDDSCIRYNSI